MPDEFVPTPEPLPPDELSTPGVAPGATSARATPAVKKTGADAARWQPPPIEEAAGLFAGYETLCLLGRGGMGAVYQARQIELDRLVAIKLLPLEISGNKDFADRFRREARALARLNHPNIVAVYDFGTTRAGHLFFVMEYVEGANLAAIIHQVGLDGDQVLSVVEQVCTALAYAHSQGIIHRDIKPANVMIDTTSHVKVADFGLARLTDPTAQQLGETTTGTVMGTPDYMAPEQTMGMNVDHRADIYSLGVMIYEMLCREVPRGIFQPPSLRTGCDARIDRIVMKALQQSPDHRYQNTAEMKADVSAARLSVAPHAEADTPHNSSLHLPTRTPVLAVSPPAATPGSKRLLYAVVAVVVTVSAYFFFRPKPEPPVTAQISLPHPGGGSPMPSPATAVPTSAIAGTTRPTREAEPAPTPPLAAQASADSTHEPRATPSPRVMPGPLASAPSPPPLAAFTAAASTTPKLASEVEKWFAQINGPQQEGFQKQVIQPFETGLADLRERYAASLETNIARKSAAGQLAAALVWRGERQAFTQAQDVSPDDTGFPADLQALRANYRQLRLRLDQTRLATAKSLWAEYDAILRKYQTLLTQRQRLDEALLLKSKRDEIARQWLGVSPGADQPPAATMASNPLPAATKDKPFENTLGMRFVPVPIGSGPSDAEKGARSLLFSVWDTRVQDYAVFVQETKHEWPKAEFEQSPTHPAVNVSWDDAQAFCGWLTKREQKAEKLSAGAVYRLPGDHEWSCAVGIGAQEDATKAPADKNGKLDDAFPWGMRWPPPAGVGNYAGEELKHALAAHKYTYLKGVLPGYRDGYAETSPVGHFPPNRFGLYDMGGNVWQWCEDWSSPAQKQRVLRGAAWDNNIRSYLLSSYRLARVPAERYLSYGFRCVIGVSPR